jgi:hypothetical protein
MPTSLNQIDHLDYNNIRLKAVALLGSGSASRGYGQSIYSNPVSPGNQITAEQWNALKTDIVNIRIHQNGLTPSIPSAEAGSTITAGAGHPYFSYDTILNSADATRFDLATTQSILTQKDEKTTSNPWSSTAETTLTVSFSTADQARYFFNSGGKIKIRGEITGGTTSQTNYWKSLLNTVGNIDFGAGEGNLRFYQLTNSYQTLFQSSSSVYGISSIYLSAAYSSNYIKVEVKSDVSSNVNGTATVLTFKISLVDIYVDSSPSTPPYDQVDGTLAIRVSELKASGVMQPTGSFAIISPSYSLAPIVVSSTPIVSPPPPAPIYSLIRSVASANEGSSFTVIFSTNQIGVFPYTITGVSSADIGGASLTGSVTNGAILTFNVTADSATEGTETFVMSLDNGQASTSVTINDTSITPPPPPPVAPVTSISPTSRSQTVSYGTTLTNGHMFITSFTVSCTSGSGTVNMSATPFASFASVYVTPASFTLSAGQSQTVEMGGSIPSGSITNPWTFTATSNRGGTFTFTINRI